MIPLDDWLTWQGLRDLATCEVFNLASGIAIVVPKPQRKPMVLEAKGFRDRRAPAVWMHLPDRVTPGPGSIIYARHAARPPWRGEVARIPVPFVLVTAFHDIPIKDTSVSEMFGGGNCKTWFGVQCATSHPQLVAMPLGLDRRTRQFWTTPQGEREHLLYLNFQCGHRSPTANVMRQALYRFFGGETWVTVDPFRKGHHAHYFQQLGRSKFVLSPPGFGWDCYRTYEAILMGAIPIVLRRPPYSDVCEGLPVLMVDDWNEITEERLNSVWERKIPAWTETLTMSYWAACIKKAAEVSTQ